MCTRQSHVASAGMEANLTQQAMSFNEGMHLITFWILQSPGEEGALHDSFNVSTAQDQGEVFKGML